MSSVTIPIPPGKVIHWKRIGGELVEVELMRFISLGELRFQRTFTRREVA